MGPSNNQQTEIWQKTFAEILSNPAVVMVIGATDTGKTTFCRDLACAAFKENIPTAVVDADVGQSEIGPPTTIGMGFVESEISSLSQIHPRRLAFVGATSPARLVLESVVGTKKMVDAARNLGARLIIVDTTGLVDGSLGRHLKTAKVDLLRPGFLIGLQKRREIERLLIPFTKVHDLRVRPLSASSEARTKPVEYRKSRREHKFYDHFAEASEHMIFLDEVSLWNTAFRSGRPVTWKYLKFIQNTIKCSVVHAEAMGTSLYVITSQVCLPEEREAVEEEFGTKSVTIIPATSFDNLIVGLADENANTMDIGIIRAIDFQQKFLHVLSPIKTISPVKVVKFGHMRINSEGKELTF